MGLTHFLILQFVLCIFQFSLIFLVVKIGKEVEERPCIE
jgi:hypothetical protein